jgi:hypothetical protein
MKSLAFVRVDAPQILRPNEDRRVAKRAADLESLSSHPPFVSVFTGRSGNARSCQEDRATTQKHTTD